MGSYFYNSDRKAEIIYHAKRGPTKVATHEIVRFFGPPIPGELSEAEQHNIQITQVKDGYCILEPR
jgi:hypothetical protein